MGAGLPRVMTTAAEQAFEVAMQYNNLSHVGKRDLNCELLNSPGATSSMHSPSKKSIGRGASKRPSSLGGCTLLVNCQPLTIAFMTRREIFGSIG